MDMSGRRPQLRPLLLARSYWNLIKWARAFISLDVLNLLNLDLTISGFRVLRSSSDQVSPYGLSAFLIFTCSFWSWELLRCFFSICHWVSCICELLDVLIAVLSRRLQGLSVWVVSPSALSSRHQLILQRHVSKLRVQSVQSNIVFWNDLQRSGYDCVWCLVTRLHASHSRFNAYFNASFYLLLALLGSSLNASLCNRTKSCCDGLGVVVWRLVSFCLLYDAWSNLFSFVLHDNFLSLFNTTVIGCGLLKILVKFLAE